MKYIQDEVTNTYGSLFHVTVHRVFSYKPGGPGDQAGSVTRANFVISSIYMRKFRTRRVVKSGQDSSILPAGLANHSAGFVSFPAHGASHIIRNFSPFDWE